jgi:hypothetical protein
MAFEAILLPGGVMPTDLAYGSLIEQLGDDVTAIAKDLEVYAESEPPVGGASSVAFAAKHPERLLSLR